MKINPPNSATETREINSATRPNEIRLLTYGLSMLLGTFLLGVIGCMLGS